METPMYLSDRAFEDFGFEVQKNYRFCKSCGRYYNTLMLGPKCGCTLVKVGEINKEAQNWGNNIIIGASSLAQNGTKQVPLGLKLNEITSVINRRLKKGL